MKTPVLFLCGFFAAGFFCAADAAAGNLQHITPPHINLPHHNPPHVAPPSHTSHGSGQHKPVHNPPHVAPPSHTSHGSGEHGYPTSNHSGSTPSGDGHHGHDPHSNPSCPNYGYGPHGSTIISHSGQPSCGDDHHGHDPHENSTPCHEHNKPQACTIRTTSCVKQPCEESSPIRVQSVCSPTTSVAQSTCKSGEKVCSTQSCHGESYSGGCSASSHSSCDSSHSSSYGGIASGSAYAAPQISCPLPAECAGIACTAPDFSDNPDTQTYSHVLCYADSSDYQEEIFSQDNCEQDQNKDVDATKESPSPAKEGL